MLKPRLQPRRPSEIAYLTVSELNAKARSVLERDFSQVLVQGEISNFIAHRSGHWYFTLKDDQSQIKCTMWRGKNQFLKFMPQDGMQVYARAKVTLYEARGDFQLGIEYLEPAGLGNLQLQFEQLKQKLTDQGLLDPDRKRPIPCSAPVVGVITSPTGAAIRDVLTVMQRRFPLTRVIIYPCQVQGKSAHLSIVDAINTANRREEVDVILLTRGGGSLEDMWCFNEESLAYAIADSTIPIVSAVGHEVDFTISDFVADLRAPTPSAAAELLTLDHNQIRQTLDGFYSLLCDGINDIILQQHNRIALLKSQLGDPTPILGRYQGQIAEYRQQLHRLIDNAIHTQQRALDKRQIRLSQSHPEKSIQRTQLQCQALFNRLIQATKNKLKEKTQLLHSCSHQLHAVSPLATLSRGYAIVLKDQQVIKSTQQVTEGELINIRLHQGEIISQVTQMIPPDDSHH